MFEISIYATEKSLNIKSFDFFFLKKPEIKLEKLTIYF